MRRITNLISLKNLIVLTIFLGLAPFLPEPHIWQKLKMLTQGTLGNPRDILDLLFHITPLAFLILKLSLDRKKT
ncbi:MAG: RND transporter [Alphaproteobacteria bacterium]|nr:RND transporter [Alphaproteobacteria bacterium]